MIGACGIEATSQLPVISVGIYQQVFSTGYSGISQNVQFFEGVFTFHNFFYLSLREKFTMNWRVRGKRFRFR